MSKKRQLTVTQGDITDILRVSPFEEGEAVQSLLDAGWECRQAIANREDGSIILTIPVTNMTDDNLYFEAALGPPQTDILDTKMYNWVVEITNENLNPVYNREYVAALVIEEEAAMNPDYTEIRYNIVSIGTAANNNEDTEVIVIDAVTLPPSIVTVKLRDADDVILQTVGYVSDVQNGAYQEVTLAEKVTVTATQLCVRHT